MREPMGKRRVSAHLGYGGWNKRTAVFNILLGKAEGMPQPFPQTAAVYFTIHGRLRSLDEDFFHLLRTLGRGQLARLGIDGTRHDA